MPWTPTNAEVSAGERVLAEVAGCSADGFWRSTAEAVLIAAHEASSTIEQVDPKIIRRYQEASGRREITEIGVREGYVLTSATGPLYRRASNGTRVRVDLPYTVTAEDRGIVWVEHDAGQSRVVEVGMGDALDYATGQGRR